jgi:glycogen debranching enzyme
VTSDQPADDLRVGDRFYILASSVAADLPRLVLKHDDAFLVADRRGDLPGLPESEFGFYADGTRFLSQLELRVHQRRPLVLNAAVLDDALQSAIELTNPDIQAEGRLILPGRTLRISRLLALHRNRLDQALSIESFAHQAGALELSWEFAADFLDVFEVRGHRRSRRGTTLPARVEGPALVLAYRGLDDVVRETRFEFAPAPACLDSSSARYRVSLPPGGRLELAVSAVAVASPAPTARRGARADAVGERRFGLRRDATRVETGHELFNRWLERARSDLHLLLTETPEGLVAYAGIPWYVAPFGRDSLITALQVLPYQPEVARGTLGFLARHQGTTDDPFTDQEPGKIFHEYRRGELAACREIPFIPYYGTVDATPLYVILLAEYLRWTGDLDLARALWPAAERALAWMEAAGSDRGYLAYRRRSPIGLDNQGWKDSRDAVMHASGELATPPIAVVEAQGYQFAALQGAAEVADAIGHPDTATACRQRAKTLQERFEADFWMDEEGFYALALDGDGRPCRVIASNAGHCLWSRIVSAPRAAAVARRLLAEDLFTGWGLRTLSSRERWYNPMSYHNGSVWPHDTAIAALGLRAYGFVEPFLTLAAGLFQAVEHFDRARMPELFCGFPRQPGREPTRYPVACSPQAWSAGVAFQIVSGMLGLAADARENRLTLDHPQLPAWLEWLELHGIRLWKSRIGLRVSRGREGTAVEVLERDGDAQVVIHR